MSSFRELKVWQKSYDLSLVIYSMTKTFPKEELFGLVSQIRRCAISIPSNIAEGHARKSKKEFIQFLYVAYGSSSELETQLQLAFDLKYINKNNYLETTSLLIEVRKMLNSLISKIDSLKTNA